MRLIYGGKNLESGTIQSNGIKKGKNNVLYLVSSISFWQAILAMLAFAPLHASREIIVAECCKPLIWLSGLSSGQGLIQGTASPFLHHHKRSGINKVISISAISELDATTANSPSSLL